jgi:hypothetical protein
MKYTLRSGVEHQFLENLGDSLKIGLPLLAILLVTAYGISHAGKEHKAQKPQTLGIYTIKTPNGTSGSTNPSGSSSAASSNAPQAASSSTPTLASSTGSSSSSTGLAAQSPASVVGGATGTVQNPAPPVGGMGGGPVGGGGGGTSIPNCSLGQIATFTCRVPACSPEVTLNPGQKAILGVTGTCVVIN